jgi:hypothetical protein
MGHLLLVGPLGNCPACPSVKTALHFIQLEKKVKTFVIDLQLGFVLQLPPELFLNFKLQSNLTVIFV